MISLVSAAAVWPQCVNAGSRLGEETFCGIRNVETRLKGFHFYILTSDDGHESVSWINIFKHIYFAHFNIFCDGFYCF